MYSFAQRSDTRVMDEPFYGYYLNLTGANHPGRQKIIDSQPKTVSDVRNWIEHTASQHDVVFIKNMAHHLINMEVAFLDEYQNVFLVRDPKELIASFAKVIDSPTMKDIGIARQHELYQFLSEMQKCPVIDSGELLKNPERILRKLCEEIGISFEKPMLHWPPKALKEDGVWARYWYKGVHTSTGFSKAQKEESPLPDHCQELYQASLPYYQEMYARALKA